MDQEQDTATEDAKEVIAQAAALARQEVNQERESYLSDKFPDASTPLDRLGDGITYYMSSQMWLQLVMSGQLTAVFLITFLNHAQQHGLSQPTDWAIYISGFAFLTSLIIHGIFIARWRESATL